MPADPIIAMQKLERARTTRMLVSTALRIAAHRADMPEVLRLRGRYARIARLVSAREDRILADACGATGSRRA